MTSAPNPTRLQFLLPGLAILLTLAAMAISVFQPIIGRENILIASDANIGHMSQIKDSLPAAFTRRWDYQAMLGKPLEPAAKVSALVLWLTPLHIYQGWNYAWALMLGTLGIFFFCREVGLRRMPSLLAGMTAFWTGTNLTLCNAGHLPKFWAMALAAWALYTGYVALGRGSVRWGIYCGALLACMFLEIADLALINMVLIGVFIVWRAATSEIPKRKSLLIVACIMTMAALGAVPSAYDTYVARAKDASVERSTPEGQWDFATQWSFPPSEMLDLFAPGYFGWKSGDPTGPYWGRTGQSAAWVSQQQGFRNFRLESVYLGAGTLAFALAVLVLWDRKSKVPVWRRTEFFFLAASAVLLLLAFGRYGPLYRMLWHLPGFSSVRNPNKFLQSFQLAYGILVGLGLQRVLSLSADEGSTRSRAVHILGRTTVIFGLLALLAAGIARGQAKHFSELFTTGGWGNSSDIIVARLTTSLVIAGIVLIATGIVIIVLGLRALGARAMLALCSVLLVVFMMDWSFVARRYITTLRIESLGARDVVSQFLVEHIDDGRVFLAGSDGLYGHWRTIVFPYNGIPIFNMGGGPRDDVTAREFMTLLSKRPDALWKAGGVKYVVAPIDWWNTVRARAPQLASQLSVVLPYSVHASPETHVVAKASSLAQTQGLVLEVKGSRGLCWATSAAKVLPAETAWLGNIDPYQITTLHSDATPNFTNTGAPATVSWIQNKLGDWRVQVDGNGEQMVVFSVRHHAALRATVDGQDTPVLRCNNQLSCVRVSAGQHEVNLRYSPPQWGVFLRILPGCLALLLLAGWATQRIGHARRPAEA